MEAYGIGMTDVGMVRKNNQDSIFIDNEKLLFVVADGMGGHAGGEVASEMVVSHFQTFQNTVLPEGKSDRKIQLFFEQEVNRASSSIYLRSLENPELRDMGTTCSMAWVHNRKAHCAHAGDSRIYILRCGFLYQLTDDHSLIAEQLKAGLISEGTAKNHALKNVITRSVGYRKEEHIDTFSQELRSGDKLLLCSDGLHGKVADEVIAKVLNGEGLEKQQALIGLANDAGGEDNISVIIVSVM